MKRCLLTAEIPFSVSRDCRTFWSRNSLREPEDFHPDRADCILHFRYPARPIVGLPATNSISREAILSMKGRISRGCSLTGKQLRCFTRG
jgi:hypothetical protein